MAVDVDYSTMSKDHLFEALGKAYETKDFKLMGKLSSLVAKAEAVEEKAKKEALLAELVNKTNEVKRVIRKALKPMYDGGELDGAEGVWFAWDFGQGDLQECKLVKSSRKPAGEGGGGSGQSSYVANPAKSADLLAQVGDEIMFAEDTAVTIDKFEQIIPAGTTYRDAYNHSTNGGWRNRIRMALLKKAGII